jgi:hypothetical protein
MKKQKRDPILTGLLAVLFVVCGVFGYRHLGPKPTKPKSVKAVEVSFEARAEDIILELDQAGYLEVRERTYYVVSYRDFRHNLTVVERKFPTSQEALEYASSLDDPIQLTITSEKFRTVELVETRIRAKN